MDVNGGGSESYCPFRLTSVLLTLVVTLGLVWVRCQHPGHKGPDSNYFRLCGPCVPTPLQLCWCGVQAAPGDGNAWVDVAGSNKIFFMRTGNRVDVPAGRGLSSPSPEILEVCLCDLGTCELLGLSPNKGEDSQGRGQ